MMSGTKQSNMNKKDYRFLVVLILAAIWLSLTAGLALIALYANAIFNAILLVR